MNIKFFTTDDDFETIIHSHFEKFDDLSQEKNGWTNFVYTIKVDDDKYYFRFPRNEFFACALEKEYQITQFINGKISFKTPNLKLYYENGKPYSIHKEIKGESLSKCYSELNFEEKQTLAEDICKMLKEFESIDLKQYLDFNFQTVSNFLDDLSYVSQNNYDITKHDYLKRLEKDHVVFSHGDFNPGNLILDNHKLVAVIDFAFAGISNEMVDLSRIVGRCPSDFKAIFMEAYLKVNGRAIDRIELEKIQDLWGYVDSQYILYIKQNHPSIVLPTLV